MKKWLTKKITREKLDIFIRSHATDKRTLDIGCSNSPYAKLFPNRVGLDVTPGDGVDVIADAHRLPFGDEEFDVVLCTEVLEHLHTPQKAIDEMYRVLKKDGKLILTTRFIFPLHDTPHDYYRYTKYGLRHLFREWKIESLEEEVSTVSTLGVLLQRIGFQTEMPLNYISRLILFFTAKCISHIPSFFIKEEFGNFSSAQKQKKEKNIMTSGYYLICKKNDD